MQRDMWGHKPMGKRRSGWAWRRGGLPLLLAVCVLWGGAPSAAGAETGFSDVPEGAWCADAVAVCRENGLLSGTGAGTFSPEGLMTRGMLVTVLYRQAGAPSLEGENLGYPFADVLELV